MDGLHLLQLSDLLPCTMYIASVSEEIVTYLSVSAVISVSLVKTFVYACCILCVCYLIENRSRVSDRSSFLNTFLSFRQNFVWRQFLRKSRYILLFDSRLVSFSCTGTVTVWCQFSGGKLTSLGYSCYPVKMCKNFPCIL